jgi:hypothetical protein
VTDEPDIGRPVPPHASGGGFPVERPPINIYRNDPDETRGRAMYRGLAEAEVRRQLAYERHKARLKKEGDPQGVKE